MDSEELLARLADIHLPEPVSFWPPALGWWLLAALLLAGLGWLGSRLLAVRVRYRMCQRALAELDRHFEALLSGSADDLDRNRLYFVNGVNSVLRRVAMVHFPDSGVASLSGEAWVDFLRNNGDASLISEQLAMALSHGRFRSTLQVDVEKLHAMSGDWIKSVYRGPGKIAMLFPPSKRPKLRPTEATGQKPVIPETDTRKVGLARPAIHGVMSDHVFTTSKQNQRSTPGADTVSDSQSAAVTGDRANHA